MKEKHKTKEEKAMSRDNKDGEGTKKKKMRERKKENNKKGERKKRK
jgi:hypothetical protein